MLVGGGGSGCRQTELAILFHARLRCGTVSCWPEPLRSIRRPEVSHAAERRRFHEVSAAASAEPDTRLFCLVLGWSGARISEALALTPAAIDIESGVASIETLEGRKRGIVRQVPFPRDTLRDLNCFFKLRVLQRDQPRAR